MPNSPVPAAATGLLENGLSRRAILTVIPAAVIGVGALATSVMAAAAPSDDPVFAAIERHREAGDRLAAAGSLTDEVLARQEGRTITDRDNDICDEACAEYRSALKALQKTVPLTASGLLAFIRYIADFPDHYDDMDIVVETLARSPVLTGV